MYRLAEWLDRERQERGGYEALRRITGLGRGTLERIIKRQQTTYKLQTLTALTKLGKSLEEIVEMTQPTAAPPPDLDATLHRLQGQAKHDPALELILSLLLRADPEERRAVLRYLGAALEEAGGDVSGTDQPTWSGMGNRES